MSLKYKVIRIDTSEDVRWNGKPLYHGIIEYIRSLKRAIRCTICRGAAGCYENGEIASQNILDASYNLPLTIEIVAPETDLETILPKLSEMVTDGIVSIVDIEVRSYHSSKKLIPQQLRVNEIMTPSPKTVLPDTALTVVVDLMLKNSLKGVPVVDSKGHPIGMITQGDLMEKVKMPIRLGLLKKLNQGIVNSFMDSIIGKSAKDIMSQPVAVIHEDQTLRETVQLMIKHHYKRLPVVDNDGVITGMLSRIDIFQTITKQAPHWDSLQEQNVVVNNTQPVKVILERDLHTVFPETPIAEVIAKLGSEEIQRIAVVDQLGKFLGIISDVELLPVISGHPGVWDVFIGKLTFTETGRQMNTLLQQSRARNAADVMLQDVISIHENTAIEEAVKIMTEHGLKRLPVVDSNAIYKGMIRRDSVLQAANR